MNIIDNMTDNNPKNFFNSEKEAKTLLNESREKIDEIDAKLIDFIAERTSLSKNIVLAKIFLDMEIYDAEREKFIYDKIKKLAFEKNIDLTIICQIMEMLTILSKNEQKEILRRCENGKY
jgi:chorismate mutase